MLLNETKEWGPAGLGVDTTATSSEVDPYDIAINTMHPTVFMDDFGEELIL